VTAGREPTPPRAPPHLLRGDEPTLPSHWYIDPAHHSRELAAIWYRHWLCVGREEELPRDRDFAGFGIGDQSALVVREPGGGLRAFHNTCRHRGSRLCDQARGRLRGAAIVCPYHGWTYGLDGALRGARHQIASPAFRREEHSLYPVAVDRWGGFLFVNLLAWPATGRSSGRTSRSASTAPASTRSCRAWCRSMGAGCWIPKTRASARIRTGRNRPGRWRLAP
jgi:Rieske 2Fe-2S family protein